MTVTSIEHSLVPGSLWGLIARVCFHFHVPYSLLSRRQFKESGPRSTNPHSDNDNVERIPDVYYDATARATSDPLMKLSG
jgi:hypothetical protein